MSIEDTYLQYKANPTAQSLNAVVETLKPTISYTLGSYDALNDPVIKAKAKIITAKAIEAYDPSYGAALPTHVSNQLRQLTRVVRENKSPLKLAERHQLDSYAIDQAEKEYIDKYGKEPDTARLADLTGLPIKRINKIKDSSYAVGTEITTAEGEDINASAEMTDYTQEALDYVYLDSDYKDKKIIEHKLGYGGKKQLENNEIAAKLKLDPAQISRRSAKILFRVNEMMDALETT